MSMNKHQTADVPTSGYELETIAPDPFSESPSEPISATMAEPLTMADGTPALAKAEPPAVTPGHARMPAKLPISAPDRAEVSRTAHAVTVPQRPPTGARLFIELDGLRARAAWIRIGKPGVTVVRLPSTDAHTLDEALAVWAPWLALGRKRRVVLLAPEAMRLVVGIPVDPQRPLSHTRMRTLLGAELETLAHRHGWSRTLGATLVGMGVLDASQVDEVLSEMRRQQQGQAFARRFGEVANALGLVDVAQLDAALQRQQVPVPTDAPVLAWLPTGGGAIDGRHPWQVVAVARSVRERAAQSLRRHGVHLEALLPVHGAAAGLLPTNASGTLVEWHHGLIGLTVLDEGRPQECHTHAVPDHVPQDESLRRLLGAATGTVWFDDRGGVAVDWLDATLNLQALPGGHQALAGLVGAANLLAQGRRVAIIPGADPPPPLYQRPWAWVATLALLLSALLMVLEWRLSAWDQDVRKRIAAQDERASLIEDVTDLRSRKTTMQADQRFWLVQVPARERGLGKLFDALARATPSTLTLTEVTEQADGSVQIRAFGSSQEDAQQFRLDLAALLQSEGWKAGGLSLSGAAGRFDITFSVSGDAP